MFIKSSLGINEIDVKSGILNESENTIVFRQNFKNSMGKPILRYTIIDKEEKRIAAFLITDMAGRAVAVAEILDHVDGVPSKILFTWHEENKVLLMEFDSPKINEEVPDSQWVAPNIHPIIDIGVE
jgi:hypothetical protein